MFSPESKIRQYVASLSSDTYDTAYRIPNTRKQYDIYVPSTI